jgi:hypothetical protein
MNPRLLIYPDTNIWNYLAQPAVDDERLVRSLTSKNASLVLSSHAVYELARTFTGKGGTGVGIPLFSSLQKFLDFGIPCSKEVMEFLKEECYAFENGLAAINPLLDYKDREIVRSEVGKLASGVVEGRVKEFIEKRTGFAADTRTDQRDHFAGRKRLKQKLKAVPESELPNWLQSETMTPAGINILFGHLFRMLGRGPTTQYVRGVLLWRAANAARSLVRADLYSNWRAANRGSNPVDLIDDMLHILLAIYSDIYVTGEKKQTEYASLLLTPGTRVAIYDLKTPIDEWLLSLV